MDQEAEKQPNRKSENIAPQRRSAPFDSFGAERLFFLS
jgi:hypothetical protein